MKLHEKIILYVIMLILAYCLFDSITHAEPYLAYDPNDFLSIESYQVELNGTIIDVKPSAVNDKARLIYDLIDIPVGANSIRARAKFKFWPWTEWSEPYIVIRPSPLANPQIISNPQ